MGVRNCADIGENLQKIMVGLVNNKKLIKLLYFDDKDPLSHADSEITEELIKNEIYQRLIRVVPKVTTEETAKSIIVIKVNNGIKITSNNEFKNVSIDIEVFVPLTQWIIKDTNLRPFAILGEIQSTLTGKTINGLGKLDGGDFELAFLTEQIACYETHYSLISYD